MMKKCLGGLAVLALLTALFATAQAQLNKSLTVNVTDGLPPTCSITCSPGNLRSSNARMTVTWSTNGNAVEVHGGGPGGTDPGGTFGASGSHSYQYAYATGQYTYYATCRKPGRSDSAASCSSILSCFPAGTKILMCDGSEKAIETITIGERIQAWSPSDKRFVCSLVNRTIQTETDKRYKFTTDKGGRQLEITPTHRLLVNGVWKDSSEVKEGDELLFADGTSVKVTKVELIVENIPVYNLETEFPNDFFAENILVHNDNTDKPEGKGLVAGMKVVLANGSLVPVEKIKAGDKLMSYDPATGRFMHTTVRSTSKQTVSKTLRINGKLRIGTKHVVFKGDHKGK